MKKITILILLFALTQSIFSQIKDCSKCDSKNYFEKDINHLTLLELKILRNEIFARHQYIFENDRLKDYFLERYDWYKPDYKSKNKIELNNFEQENSSLFLKKENEKITLKKTIIEKLKVFKQALINKDTITTNSSISKFVTDNEYVNLSAIRKELKEILTSINIDGIHWYNERGLFKVTTDDGHFLNETSVTINGSRVIVQYAGIGHSELLKDETAFSFGSDFYSVNEYQSWYTFEIQNNKLILIKHQAAG